MDKLIITVVAGGESAETRAVPLQAAAAIASCQAGASIAQLRARLSPGREPDLDDWVDLRDRVRADCDVLLQFGRATMPADVRRRLFELGPDTASFLLGHHSIVTSDGFLDGLATLAEQREVARLCREYGILPECRVYSSGNTWNMRQLVEEGLLEPPFFATLALGRPGGEWSPATPHELTNRLALLPEGTVWGVTVHGPEAPALDLVAIAMGGHVWVIPEHPTEPEGLVDRTARAVERMVRLARDVGREVATPADARRILALPRSKT